MLGLEDRVLEVSEERERLDLQRYRIEGILADESISEEMERHLRQQLGQIYLRLWSLGVSIEAWPGAVPGEQSSGSGWLA
jgi:flagellar capping protein FliD